MVEKRVARTLFKKLSALRATLSDAEQELLDRMITGSFVLSAPAALPVDPPPSSQESGMEGRGGRHEARSSKDESPQTKNETHKAAGLSIRYDEANEAYVVEYDLPVDLDTKEDPHNR